MNARAKVSGQGDKGPLSGANVRLYSYNLSKTDCDGTLPGGGSKCGITAITHLLKLLLRMVILKALQLECNKHIEYIRYKWLIYNRVGVG